MMTLDDLIKELEDLRLLYGGDTRVLAYDDAFAFCELELRLCELTLDSGHRLLTLDAGREVNSKVRWLKPEQQK